jgi:hypothetical protein
MIIDNGVKQDNRTRVTGRQVPASDLVLYQVPSRTCIVVCHRLLVIAGLSKQSFFFCTHNFCIDHSSSSTGLCRPALKVVCAKTHVMFEICFKQKIMVWHCIQRAVDCAFALLVVLEYSSTVYSMHISTVHSAPSV